MSHTLLHNHILPQTGSYKYWVECRGNNHNLVKQQLKKRHWFTWHDINA
jgi:hypothetical protein